MADDGRSQQATLGCGTLILIALIVIIFSNADTSELEGEVRNLQSEVGELKTVIEQQTVEIRELRNRLPIIEPAP